MVVAMGRRPWIGVDLDGTLFTYDKWVTWNTFGEPIAPMVERVRRWQEQDQEVRIVTARVGLPLWMGHTPTPSTHLWSQCRVSGERFSDRMMVDAIQAHCVRHIGFAVPVQCYKDLYMIELWDDRAVQVIPNTGMRCCE